MADLRDFSITPGSPKGLVLPRQIIQARVISDEFPFNTIADFTGENALEFPEVFSTLTQDQQNALIRSWATTIVLLKAGVITEPLAAQSQ